MKPIRNIFVAIEHSRAFGRGLLTGISNYARIHGPWMFLQRHELYFGGGRSFSRLKKGAVHGAIIREPLKRDMEQILKLGMPIIVSRHWTTCSSLSRLVTDDLRIGQMGATHFLDRGFRHFAFCGTGAVFWSEQRCKSFVETVTQAGYSTKVYKRPSRGDPRWNNEERLLAEWVGSLPKPVGLMACTDDRAFELVQACNVAGVKIPEEVAILGVDNDDLVCQMATVPLSSVALHTEQAGFNAAGLLDQLMKSERPEPQEIVISPTHIQERRSTDILAIEDPVVAKALQFIHIHTRQPLRVAEVAQHVGVSQRSLFARFEAALRRTVYEEITRVRISHIAFMLETTTLSTKQIAELMGMPDGSHLSRYFQREKGLSPIAWRKQQLGIRLEAIS